LAAVSKPTKLSLGSWVSRKATLAKRPGGCLATTLTVSRAECVWDLGPMGGRIRDD